MDASSYDQAVEVSTKNCLAVRLRLLNRVVTNLFDDALRPHGVKASQLNIPDRRGQARRGPVGAGLRGAEARRVNVEPEC